MRTNSKLGGNERRQNVSAVTVVLLYSKDPRSHWHVNRSSLRAMYISIQPYEKKGQDRHWQPQRALRVPTSTINTY